MEASSSLTLPPVGRAQVRLGRRARVARKAARRAAAAAAAGSGAAQKYLVEAAAVGASPAPQLRDGGSNGNSWAQKQDDVILTTKNFTRARRRGNAPSTDPASTGRLSPPAQGSHGAERGPLMPGLRGVALSPGAAVRAALRPARAGAGVGRLAPLAVVPDLPVRGVSEADHIAAAQLTLYGKGARTVGDGAQGAAFLSSQLSRRTDLRSKPHGGALSVSQHMSLSPSKRVGRWTNPFAPKAKKSQRDCAGTKPKLGGLKAHAAESHHGGPPEKRTLFRESHGGAREHAAGTKGSNREDCSIVHAEEGPDNAAGMPHGRGAQVRRVRVHSQATANGSGTAEPDGDRDDDQDDASGADSTLKGDTAQRRMAGGDVRTIQVLARQDRSGDANAADGVIDAGVSRGCGGDSTLIYMRGKDRGEGNAERATLVAAAHDHASSEHRCKGGGDDGHGKPPEQRVLFRESHGGTRERSGSGGGGGGGGVEAVARHDEVSGSGSGTAGGAFIRRSRRAKQPALLSNGAKQTLAPGACSVDRGDGAANLAEEQGSLVLHGHGGATRSAENGAAADTEAQSLATNPGTRRRWYPPPQSSERGEGGSACDGDAPAPEPELPRRAGDASDATARLYPGAGEAGEQIEEGGVALQAPPTWMYKGNARMNQEHGQDIEDGVAEGGSLATISATNAQDSAARQQQQIQSNKGFRKIFMRNSFLSLRERLSFGGSLLGSFLTGGRIDSGGRRSFAASPTKKKKSKLVCSYCGARRRIGERTAPAAGGGAQREAFVWARREVLNDEEAFGQRVERLFLCPKHEAACVERLDGAMDQSVILLKTLLWEALRNADIDAKIERKAGNRGGKPTKRWSKCFRT